ncbi:hypothetical protein FG379_000015 [Cryptosporidium bovis]|uniref:uncharacterized protein n=1 Tax=Cryptosporidium bovis TaxID=310047 RepID=UPI00351A74D3|nr:hypothetical protein FG379_000015 [Cryptosporidium bovis]
MNVIKLLNTKIIHGFLWHGVFQKHFARRSFGITKYGLILNFGLRKYYAINSSSVTKLRNLPTCSDSSMFSLKSEKLFADIGEKLENICEEGLIQDVDFNDEFINIIFEDKSGKYHNNGEKNTGTIVISKQSSTKQIWYSSPFRKPDYFEFNNDWRSERTKKTLSETLKEDILLCSGVNVDF